MGKWQSRGKAIDEGITEFKEGVKETYEKGKKAVVDAYDKTTDYVEEKYEQGKRAIKKGAHAVDEAFDNAVTGANEALQKGYTKVQELDDKYTEAVKFDLPEEEAQVDPSTLTDAEYREYAEKRMAELTIGHQVKELGKDAVDGVKKVHNNLVDRQHNFRENVRSTVAGWLNKGADALKGMFDW